MRTNRWCRAEVRLLISEFCEATGLDEATTAGLVANGILDGCVDRHGRLFGLFDDSLPSTHRLKAEGLVIANGYDALVARSHEVEDDEGGSDDQDDVGPNWSMTWAE